MSRLFMFLAMAIFASGCAAHGHAHTHSSTTTVRTTPPPQRAAARPPAPGPNCTWVRSHYTPRGAYIRAHWTCGPRGHVWVSGRHVTVRINGIPTRRYVQGHYRAPNARPHRHHSACGHTPRRPPPRRR